MDYGYILGPAVLLQGSLPAGIRRLDFRKLHGRTGLEMFVPLIRGQVRPGEEIVSLITADKTVIAHKALDYTPLLAGRGIFGNDPHPVHRRRLVVAPHLKEIRVGPENIQEVGVVVAAGVKIGELPADGLSQMGQKQPAIAVLLTSLIG